MEGICFHCGGHLRIRMGSERTVDGVHDRVGTLRNVDRALQRFVAAAVHAIGKNDEGLAVRLFLDITAPFLFGVFRQSPGTVVRLRICHNGSERGLSRKLRDILLAAHRLRRRR